MKIPQLLPQLQTPEQNGGAARIDALMSASAEGFKLWSSGRLVRHEDEPAVGLAMLITRGESVCEMCEE